MRPMDSETEIEKQLWRDKEIREDGGGVVGWWGERKVCCSCKPKVVTTPSIPYVCLQKIHWKRNKGLMGFRTQLYVRDA